MFIIDLFYNLSLLVALSVISGFIDIRFRRTELAGKIFQGLLFGTATIIGMLYPFILTEGIIFDGRSILISLCTLFFGPVSGVITALIAIIYRNIIGGSGALMGSLVILTSFTIGLIFYYWKNNQAERTITNLHLYLIGLLVHAAMMLTMFALPQANILAAFETLSVAIIGVYPFVTLLIGKILLDQERNRSYVQKIRDSEEKYRLLIENQTDLIVKTDLNGKILFVNPAYCQLFDKSENDLIGNSYIPLIHEDDVPIVQKAVESLFNPPYTCSYIERAYTKYGLRWIEWDAKAVLDSNGKITALIGTGRDITERKIAEEALKFSEDKYRQLAENTHAILISTNERGRITYINEAAAAAFGYKPDEIIGRFYLKYVLPEDREQVHSRFTKQLFQASPDNKIEFRYLKNRTEIGWLSFLVNPLITDKKVTGLTGVGLDITESKIAELELIKLNRAIEQSSISVFITDQDGNIEYVNPYFTKLTGYSLSEVKGKNPRFLKSGHHSDVFYSRLWVDIKAGKDWQGEMYNKKKNGEYYWENTVISPIVNKKDEITHFVAIQEDITEQKKMHEDLVAAKNKAEEMNRVKSIFFANMSHELRTPMIGILGNAELLELEIQDEQQRKMIRTVRKSALRLHETLNSILDISKIEVEGIQKTIRPFDLIELIEESVQLFKSAANEKGLSLKYKHPADKIIIDTDDNLLAKILNNLINNAVKYSDKGEINIRSEVVDKFVEISVEDNGIGIAEENLKLIFEPFRQTSEGFSRIYEGTGLGLTITKRFVEVLGGEISVRSKKGKGSVFTVKLPVSHLASDLSEVIEKPAVDNIDKIKLKGFRKLLLVEDEAINAEVILKLLSEEYNTDWVQLGDEAVKAASENNYDAVLMDIGLRGDIDGLETAQIIRKIPGYDSRPIIAVTAYAMTGDKEKFLENGCTHYLSKPFHKNELLKTLDEAINSVQK